MLQEGKCSSGLPLCCHVFKTNQRESSKASSTRQNTQAGDGEPCTISRVEADHLQDITQHLLKPAPHNTPQSKRPLTKADRIPSLQSENENTKNTIKKSNTAEHDWSAVHHLCLSTEKDTYITHQVLLHGAVLQPVQQGVATTQQRKILAGDKHYNDHKAAVALEEDHQEKQTAEESVDITEKENSEEHEPSLLHCADFKFHEAMEDEHSSRTSLPSTVDKVDVTVNGNHYPDEHDRQVFENGFRNLLEVVPLKGQCSTSETVKPLIKYKNDEAYYVGETLQYYENSAEPDGTEDIIHTSFKTHSVSNPFSDAKQADKSLGVHEDGYDVLPSKLNVFYPQSKRLEGLRHPRALEEEPFTSLVDKGNGDADLNWKNSAAANKYQPVELHFDTERQVYPVFSSFLLPKGVTFSIFFWAYLVAFLYAACYIMSSFLSPFSVLGVIMKFMLVYYFPSIIQLEVFRAVDFILAFIYKTFT